MIINSKVWGFKLYRWWLERKVKSNNGWDEIEYYENNEYKCVSISEASMALLHREVGIAPNFCLYVRAVLLYAPLRKLIFNKCFLPSLANIIIYSFIAAMFISDHFMNQIAWEISSTIIVLICFFAIAASILGLCLCIRRIRRGLRNKSSDSTLTPSVYTTVIKPYIKAKKQKICPMLTFEEDEASK